MRRVKRQAVSNPFFFQNLYPSYLYPSFNTDRLISGMVRNLTIQHDDQRINWYTTDNHVILYTYNPINNR